MPKINRQAGQNVRGLAFRRRKKAIASFISAGFVILSPLFGVKFVENFLKTIVSLNPSYSQILSNLPPILYVFCIVTAFILVKNGRSQWKRAALADQGAKGEEDVAEVMLQLKRKGWQIEYDLLLNGGLGDADIICISPNNKAFVIEVKSHRGDVKNEGDELYRQMGKNRYSFEKNFLAQVMKQAFQIKQQKNLDFVTPIIVFSQARVSVSGKLKGVYVVEKARLITLLTSLSSDSQEDNDDQTKSKPKPIIRPRNEKN